MQHITKLKRNKLYMGCEYDLSNGRTIYFFKYRGEYSINILKTTVYSTLYRGGFDDQALFTTRQNNKREIHFSINRLDNMYLYEISFDEFALHVVSEII